MSFTDLHGTYPLLALGLVLLLVAQNWLIKQSSRWLGSVVPTVYLGLLLFFAVTGTLMGLTDLLFASLGFVGLVGWWVSARSTKRTEIEEDRPLLTPMTAVDSRVSFPPPGTGVRRHYQPRVG